MGTNTVEELDAPQKLSPLIRWAGSKRRLLPKLAEYWAAKDHARYLEPFAGSGALYFHLMPQYGLLNDINSGLMEVYRAIASDPTAVHVAASEIATDEGTYYKVRSMDSAGLTETGRAARFVYLNRFCFNGIYRTNKNGDFNVPYGGGKSGALPSLERFIEAAKLLQRAQLYSLDFEVFVRGNVKSGDFVYLDPPYAVANRRVFRQYDPNTFGTADVARLALLLEHVNEVGATFLVSYAHSAEIGAISKRWASRRVHAQRNVAGFTEHRRKAVEVMITNLG